GRGGKLHVVCEGSFFSRGKFIHVSPPSSERNNMLGSVPAQTTLYSFITSALLTATLATRLEVIPPPVFFHVCPLSSLTHSPLSNVPPYIRSGCTGSVSKHKNGKGVFISVILHAS